MGVAALGGAEIANATVCRFTPADIVEGRFANENIMKVADAADALAFGSAT